MNLATRCLTCGTVFRVGEAQLLASDGWVRCGRCNGVFNAAEVLFDADTGTPMTLALPPAGAPGETDPAAPVADADLPAALPGADEAPADALLRAPSRDTDDEPIVIVDHVAPPAPLSPLSTLSDEDDEDDGDRPAALADLDARTALTPAAGARYEGPAASAAADAPPREVQAAPGFLREARRAARWRQPVVQAGLWAGVLLLALGLLLQTALLWRDSLAAHLPGTAPALQALCRVAGCSVQPLRRIQLLALESSGLNRLDGSPLYRLQLVLRNRADTAVMMPAVDLALTDPQGQLVARRVLPMADLGVPQAALQPGQELPIQVLMSTGERRVAGYTLELFYP